MFPPRRTLLTVSSIACVAAMPAAALPVTAGFELTLQTASGGTANAPLFVLRNASDAGIQLLSFNLTIGHRDRNFDYVQSIVAPMGGAAVALRPDGVNALIRSADIEFAFTGFDSGEFVSWRSDIDTNFGAMNSSENVRIVMFNNGVEPNAVATARFAVPDMTDALTVSLTLPDGPVGDVSYSFSGAIELAGPPPPPTSPPSVAVPASAPLLALGLGGLVLVRGRRRGRAGLT